MLMSSNGLGATVFGDYLAYKRPFLMLARRGLGSAFFEGASDSLSHDKARERPPQAHTQTEIIPAYKGTIKSGKAYIYIHAGCKRTNPTHGSATFHFSPLLLLTRWLHEQSSEERSHMCSYNLYLGPMSSSFSYIWCQITMPHI